MPQCFRTTCLLFTEFQVKSFEVSHLDLFWLNNLNFHESYIYVVHVRFIPLR